MRPNIFPALHYRDPDAALEWLKRAFGFEEKAVYRGDDGRIHHAELRLGDGLIMFGGIRADAPGPDAPGPDAPGPDAPGPDAPEPNKKQPPVTIYAVVTDPDAHYNRSKAAGAEIVRDLADQPYGSREYGARDLEGNAWSFGTYDPYDP